MSYNPRSSYQWNDDINKSVTANNDEPQQKLLILIKASEEVQDNCNCQPRSVCDM